MGDTTEIEKPKGRAPAKLNVRKPGVGMTFIVRLNVSEAGKKPKYIYSRIGTTCRRDTDAGRFNGQLPGVQLTNYSGVPGAGMGEKYFIGKLGRKGYFEYVLFLCDERHKKCLGATVKPADLHKDKIEATIGRLLASAVKKGTKASVKTDKEGVIILQNIIPDVFEFEWIDKSMTEAKAEGMKLYAMNSNGVFEEIVRDEPKSASPKAEAKTEAKTEAPKAKKAKKTAAKKSDAPAIEKVWTFTDSGAAKKLPKEEVQKDRMFGTRAEARAAGQAFRDAQAAEKAKAEAAEAEDTPAEATEVEATEATAESDSAE